VVDYRVLCCHCSGKCCRSHQAVDESTGKALPDGSCADVARQAGCCAVRADNGNTPQRVIPSWHSTDIAEARTGLSSAEETSAGSC